MSNEKKPILNIRIAQTSTSVWTGFLSSVTPKIMADLQTSLFDEEAPEKYLAELYLGSEEDLRKAKESGSHPAKYLQEHCQELFLGDYIDSEIHLPINKVS